MYVPPQLHGANFQYLRVPHLNVGRFVAPRLSDVPTAPSNPSPSLATQLAAQFVARDHLVGASPPNVAPLPVEPVPVTHVKAPPPRTTMRGRTPSRNSPDIRTHGAGSSGDSSFLLFCFPFCL